MFASLPRHTVPLGLAGLLPFLFCAAGATGGAPGPFLAALIAYGAVILAFLGGAHWGFALQSPDAPRRGERLTLGVVPSLIGWAALLLPAPAGLAVLIAGFAATLGAEIRWARLGLVPPPYMTLRILLSACVLLILAAVFVLHLAGTRLVF